MIIDFYMHDRAEFGLFKLEFADFEDDFGVYSAEIPEKQANSAAKKPKCAYNFDFFTFLYAFSGETWVFGHLRGPPFSI